MPPTSCCRFERSTLERIGQARSSLGTLTVVLTVKGAPVMRLTYASRLS